MPSLHFEASRIALLCWEATQKPTLKYAIITPVIFHEDTPKPLITQTTGDYRCSNLDRE